jgi:hypothetical protein
VVFQTLTISALCAFLSLQSSSARAAEAVDIDALVHHGVELRKQGRDDLALPLFERAYQMAPAGRTAAQLGLVRLALEDWVGADELLTTSLKMGGPWIEKNRSVLEDALQTARSHLGRLTVTGAPDGATVLVDGKRVATLPMANAVKLAEGQRHLMVRAPGLVDFTKDVVIHGQEAEMVDVRREEPRLGSPAAFAVATPAPEHQGRVGRAILPWAFGAAAVGGLIFGIVEHLRWSQGSHDFDAVTVSGGGSAPACAVTAPMHGLDRSCNTLYERFTTARTLTFVGYGAAAALAATSATLFILNAKSPEQTSGELAHVCGPDLIHRGWQCTLSF